jgi:hypothetical protein
MRLSKLQMLSEKHDVVGSTCRNFSRNADCRCCGSVIFPTPFAGRGWAGASLCARFRKLLVQPLKTGRSDSRVTDRTSNRNPRRRVPAECDIRLGWRYHLKLVCSECRRLIAEFERLRRAHELALFHFREQSNAKEAQALRAAVFESRLHFRAAVHEIDLHNEAHRGKSPISPAVLQ